jgi:hypothetical protein
MHGSRCIGMRMRVGRVDRLCPGMQYAGGWTWNDRGEANGARASEAREREVRQNQGAYVRP